jgi:hypothetical protein
LTDPVDLREELLPGFDLVPEEWDGRFFALAPAGWWTGGVRPDLGAGDPA